MAANAPPRPVLDQLPDLETLRLELRGAVSDSLDRSLNSSAKFAAELVAALPRPAAARTTTARRPPVAAEGGPVASTSANTLDFDPQQHSQRRPPPPPAGSPHVHFRTSTPVKTTPGGGGISTPAEESNRWSGAAGAVTTASAARPRDSFGSVLSMGGGPSSPVVAAIEEEDEAGDESMHGNSATTAGAGTADLQALRAEWRARDDDEQDLHLLAQTYMRNHELMRAAHVLRDCTGPKARWTRCYARYMVRRTLYSLETLTPGLILPLLAPGGRETGPGRSGRTPRRQGPTEAEPVHARVARRTRVVRAWVHRPRRVATVPVRRDSLFIRMPSFLSRQRLISSTLRGYHSRPTSSSSQKSALVPLPPSHDPSSLPLSHQRSDDRLSREQRLAPRRARDARQLRAGRTVQLVCVAQDCRMPRRSGGGECARLSDRILPSAASADLDSRDVSPPPQLEATMPFLPSGYPLLFFYVHCSLEIHAANHVLLDIVDELEQVFGRECAPVTGMRALVHYHMRGMASSLATAPGRTALCFSAVRLPDADVAILNPIQTLTTRPPSSTSCTSRTRTASKTSTSCPTSCTCRRSEPNSRRSRKNIRGSIG